ncbi:MAG: 2-oxoglutarate oxidoreductase, beta subunit [Candidatus Ozemobacter sibiricus]|uniref:2-oxoglutarate oxidoreductase, beta subunit n=1 Tax=Candidatus Ozemobacter sibiricus TaxID=2268124 RepID=A0A367ZNM5_9BACT|nr:MAG: 2-oxoglutarate oxidoreductase, beta subunit [Candidatus Ozemobacter sibiricus]
MTMEQVFARPKCMTKTPFHYCPGCDHGVVHRLIGESLDELELGDKTIGVAPVGCSVFAFDYFTFDFNQAAHGRAPAVATGIKRVRPDHIVFTYQGDGDLAAIGTAEIIHAANRGEKITVIFINNAIYGMTGGQMAPTTLVGMKTATSPYGRDAQLCGNPIKMAEMLATLEAPVYVTRVSVNTPANLMKAKKALKNAFRLQKEGKGFTFVEVVCICPTNWGKTPNDAHKWLAEKMLPVFPLGTYKDVLGVDKG